MSRLKLGILYGGESSERKISRLSCENIVKNLDDEKYDLTLYKVPSNGDRRWVKDLINNPPELILNALHGGSGEDGSVQGLLSTLNIPYIGSRVLASALCMNKANAKITMNRSKIPVLPDVLLKLGEDPHASEEEIKLMGFPLIVKPNSGGSSLGINVCDTIEELYDAVNVVFEQYHDDALVEKYVDGKEVTCAILQSKEKTTVLPVLDVRKEGKYYGFNDKYYSEDPLVFISTLPDFMQDMVKHIALKTFDTLKCRGYACVDMLIKDENIYVIEVNTLPGLTEKSLIPCAVQGMGITFSDLLDRLIDFER